jgi:DNA-binding MurR/RpiR family transcriptional regulator
LALRCQSVHSAGFNRALCILRARGLFTKSNRYLEWLQNQEIAIQKIEDKSLGTIGPDDLFQELRRRYDRLSLSQKRIAEYILEHPQEIAFSTSDQMATELDLAPSTITRFAYRLGLNGYPELQERMRQLVRGELSRAGVVDNARQSPNRLEDTSFGASLSQDRRNLQQIIAGVDVDAFERAINILVRARRIAVLTGNSAFPVASYFARSLDRLRTHVSSFPDELETREIECEDCMVVFSFAPHENKTHRAALDAKQNNAKLIVVTDSPTSEVGPLADVVFLAAHADIGDQSSIVAAMALVNALRAGVYALMDPESH